MKKYLIMIISMMVLLPSIANAGSVTATSSIDVIVGQTGKFTVTANDAAGAVNVTSSNPSIATVSNSGVDTWVENGSISFTVTGVSIGTTTMKVALVDVSDSDENLIQGTRTVNVNVVPAPTQAPQTTVAVQTTQPTTKKSTQPKTTTLAPQTQEIITTSLADVVLKLTSVTVDEFNVTYQDGKYYVTTDPTTESVTVSATADAGISVIGVGNRTLTTGKNIVELILRNEAGASTTVQVVITKPEDNTVHDTTLSRLKVVDYKLDFEPNKFEYTITVPSTAKEVYVIAESYNPDVSIVGGGLHVLQKGKDKIIIKSSYGDRASSEYVININRSYSALFMWIAIGILSAGLIGALVYAKMSKDKAVSSVISEKNKIIATNNVTGARDAGISVGGESVVGLGRATVVPTKVIDTKEPVTPVNPVQVAASVNEVPVAPKTEVVTVSQQPQVKVVTKTVVPTPVQTVQTVQTTQNENI